MGSFVQPSLRLKGGIHSPFFIDRACYVLGVSRDDLLANRSAKGSARRWALILVCKKAKNLSAARIAQALCQNVSSVQKAIPIAEERLKTVPEFAGMVADLEAVA